jgi:nucleoid-associated protein YgaU
MGSLLVLQRARGKNNQEETMNTHRKNPRYTRGNKVLGVFLLLTVGLMVGLTWMIGISHTSTPQPRASATHSATVKGSEPSQHVTPAPPVKATAPKAVVHKATPTYTVKPGDSLWSIAGSTLHNPLDWHQIYEMNLHTIGGNPNLIHAGQVLQL